MTRFSFFLRAFVLAFLLLAIGPALHAEPIDTGSMAKPTETKPLSLVPAAQQIGEQLQSLVAPPAPSEDDTETPPPETFGTRALNVTLNILTILHAQAEVFTTHLAAWDPLATWVNQQITDPRLQARWLTIGNDLFFAGGFSLAAFVLLELALLPLRRKLRQRTFASLSKKWIVASGLLAIRLFPIFTFLIAALIMLSQIESQRLPRFFVMNVVYAFVISRLALSIASVVLSPRVEALRPLPLSTAQARYAYRWLGFFTHVIVFGYFLIGTAPTLRIPSVVIDAFGNILGLVLVMAAATITIQKRHSVALMLGRRPLRYDDTFLQTLRNALAARWHIFAIAYLVIGYIVTASGVEKGFTTMVRGTILTIGLLMTMRFLLQALTRSVTTRAGSLPFHGIFLRLFIWVFGGLGLLAAWGTDIPALAATPIGQRVTGAAFSIGVTILAVMAAYRLLNAAIERQLHRTDASGLPLEASSRARTLLPLLRNTMLVLFFVVILFVVLSEVGVNVGPLLAGAGIIGVAVGFGSQTLVKDFITGLFIIMENSIAVGDTVKIGDHTGAVENMSLRTLRLRDFEGQLHILPFSEVTQIINMTKGFSFARIDIGVAYDSDLEKVMDVMRQVGAEVQKDPAKGGYILQPLEMMGVEKLGDSSISLLARFRTIAGKQHDVRRLYLLRLKQRFDQEGIDIPFPTVMHLQKKTV